MDKRTLFPLSIKFLSQTATSRANRSNSFIWVSRSCVHLFTTSSIDLPRSSEGGWTAAWTFEVPMLDVGAAADVAPAVGAAPEEDAAVIPPLPRAEPSVGTVSVAGFFSPEEGCRFKVSSVFRQLRTDHLSSQPPYSRSQRWLSRRTN